MNALPEPPITVDVNLRNPGQFFACCGLLELAGRLWPGSEGWFGEDRGRASFFVTTPQDGNLPKIVDALTTSEPLVTLAKDHEDHAGDRKPVVLGRPFDLRLDWWLDSYRGGEKSELKVWAGQMTPERNLLMLQEKLRAMKRQADGRSPWPGCSLLSLRTPASGIGIDPATSWTAINVGFSPDEQSVDVLTSPATEIFAMIGLQRCRPTWDDTKRRRWFIYRAWAEPLPASVAPAALAGVTGRSLSTWTFPVEMRNAQYGNFGWAKPWETKT